MKETWSPSWSGTESGNCGLLGDSLAPLIVLPVLAAHCTGQPPLAHLCFQKLPPSIHSWKQFLC